MNRNVSLMLIAAVAGIMIAGALAVTMTNAAFAATGSKGGAGGPGANPGLSNGVNGGGNSHAHDPCEHSGPAEHNPNCQ